MDTPTPKVVPTAPVTPVKPVKRKITDMSKRRSIPPITVVWDKRVQQFRKNIGHFKTVTGERRAQRFWLGRNPETAKLKAIQIEARRQVEEAKGYDHWTESVLDDLCDQGLTQQRRGRKVAVTVAAKAVLPLRKLKLDPDAAQYLAEDGSIKPECYLDFQKFAITKMIGQDQPTQVLLDQVNELWHNDALTTLERITRLNIAPSIVNIGFNGNGFVPVKPTDLDATASGKSVLDLIELKADEVSPSDAEVLDADSPEVSSKPAWSSSESI